jgi:hypothetical protein
MGAPRSPKHALSREVTQRLSPFGWWCLGGTVRLDVVAWARPIVPDRARSLTPQPSAIVAVRNAVIGRHLGIQAVSVAAEKATEHFGPFGMVMTLGIPPMSNAPTRQLLGWVPYHPGLIADLDQGHYFFGQ